ncbi:MAG: MFS transporter [Desulfomonilaceae bacterium]
MIIKLLLKDSAEQVTDKDVRSGLRVLLYDGVCSQVMDTLTSGAFLVAFALLLGASNTVVGLLAAVCPITQLVLEIPATYLVNRTATHKQLVVFSSWLGRVFWLVIAVLPWIVESEHRRLILIACLFLYYAFSTVSACGFGPWVRDFVPENIMGKYFGSRMAVATAAGMVAALVAAAGLQSAKWYVPDQIIPYSVIFGVGGIVGLLGVYFLVHVPEPKLEAYKPQGLADALWEPIHDLNFRRLLMYLGGWLFAINLSGPFYAVFMLKTLGLSMPVVIGLGVLSQITSIFSFRIWGKTADNLSNKSVLIVSSYIYLVSVLLWPPLALSESYFWLIPLLVAVHVLTGFSSAGINLCSDNIIRKSAPHGHATAFLAVNTMVRGIASAAAPILGGVVADHLTGKHLSDLLHSYLRETGPVLKFLGSGLLGIHVLFSLTAILGVCAIWILRAVHEGGEVEWKVVVASLAADAKEVFGNITKAVRLRHP